MGGSCTRLVIETSGVQIPVLASETIFPISNGPERHHCVCKRDTDTVFSITLLLAFKYVLLELIFRR